MMLCVAIQLTKRMPVFKNLNFTLNLVFSSKDLAVCSAKIVTVGSPWGKKTAVHQLEDGTVNMTPISPDHKSVGHTRGKMK